MADDHESMSAMDLQLISRQMTLIVASLFRAQAMFITKKKSSPVHIQVRKQLTKLTLPTIVRMQL
jgi:hypothetical protein